jgi:hypothetical protein
LSVCPKSNIRESEEGEVEKLRMGGVEEMRRGKES